jgi:hypothetical protein
MASRGSVPPPPKSDRGTFDQRGEQLLQAVSKLRGAGGGGAQARGAPRWFHKLVDAVWDFFTE